MPRINGLSRADAPPEIVRHYDEVFGEGRDPVREPGTAAGTVGNWWTTWARVPGILNAFSAYSYRNAPIDPQLREIALIRTGYVRQSQFVFSQHCKSGRKAGLAESKIAAIPYWTVAEVFSPLERAVLAYVDGQMLESGRVHDRVFEALRDHLSEEEILIFTYLINAYSMHATATRALQLEFDDVPERVVEVPSPGDGVSGLEGSSNGDARSKAASSDSNPKTEHAMNLSRPTASITSDAAHSAVAAGVAKAAEMGWRMSIAVVDRGGNLIALLRNEDAPLHSTGLAIDKAYTAVSFNMPTKDWNQVLGTSSAEVKSGIVTRERLVVFGGGLPIRKDGTLHGAIGASGGMEDQDEICVRAALASIGADKV